MSHRLLGQLVAGWMIVMGCAAVPLPAQVQLPEKSRQQIAELLADKENRTPAQQKISSRLLYAEKISRGVPLTRSLPSLPRIASAFKKSTTVEVDIDGEVGAPLLSAIAGFGGRIESSLPRYHTVRAWLPLAALEPIAEREDVWRIKEPGMAATMSELRRGARPGADFHALFDAELKRALSLQPRSGLLFAPSVLLPNIVDTGGVLAHGVDQVAQDGSGVKVAVMSDGIMSVSWLVPTGGLPTVTWPPGQAGLADGDEGTAELQHVHDLAPGAELYFAAGKVGPAQFASNIETLVDTYHVNIIVDDMQLTDDPVFQDGVTAQAVNYAYSKGVMFFSASGNDNNYDSGLSGTWEGMFADSGEVLELPDPVNKSYHYHLFPSGAKYLRLGNQTGDINLPPTWVFLQWADPWDCSCNDYDLIITDSTGSLLDASTNVQHCIYSEPVELIPRPNDAAPAPADGDLIWIAKTNAASPVMLHLNTGRGTLWDEYHNNNYGTAGATFGHSSAEGAMSVGAVNVASTAGGAQGGGGIFTGGAANPVELYSADGPRHLLSGQSCSPYTQGTVNTVRIKPDILAGDGGACSIPGFSPYFFGTSASAPHAAAVGALLKQADPYLTPGSAYTALEMSALTVTANPYQPNGVATRTQGAGIIRADLAIPLVKPTITLQTSPISQTISLSGSQCLTGSFNGLVHPTLFTDATCTVSLDNPIVPQGANARYIYRNWSDGATSNPRTLTVPVGPATFTANYVLQFQLTTSVTPAGGGTVAVSPDSADGYYDNGTAVTLTAVPANGYSFSGFTGSGYGASPQTVVLSQPLNVVATFVPSGSPPLGVTSSHAGSFQQGQTGAFTITVTNQSPASSTSGTVTVTENLPAGLTLVSMLGDNWSCSTATATCSRSDPLAHGASYPAITVTVSVAFTATSPQVNSVSVSGGGGVAGSTTDSVAITPASSLSISKTHTGNFTQGQNGATYTVTVNNAAGSSVSGPVTVTENLPSGLTLVSMLGDGWTCTSGGNTCTRNTALAAGASYPAITVTVNVPLHAASPQVNSVTVSGGGSLPATAADSTTINQTALGTSLILEGPAAGSDVVLFSILPASAGWSAQSNSTWLHLAAGSTSGTGGAVVHFTFDANTGAARSGTFTIGNQTLTVTQAGAGFLAASTMVTLVPSGLNEARDIGLDAAGNVYIADSGNNMVKEWNATTKQVTTLVSSGLSTPAAVAVDAQGNVYIADSANQAIKVWNPTTQTVITLMYGVSTPGGVAVDAQGNVYSSDTGDNTIREWNAATQTVSTLVSSGLNRPTGIALDVMGNVYIADTENNAVKKWDATAHTVSTLSTPGLSEPAAVAVDGQGNVYVADHYRAIKMWKASTQAFTTVVTGITAPYGVAVDSLENVYVSDTFNSAIEVLDVGYVGFGATNVNEPLSAGSDSVAVQVLPASLPVTATSDSTWLTITSTSGGAVSFSFTAYNGVLRTAHITVLGQQITVTQAAATPPVLGISKTHTGTFTRAQNGATYTVKVSNAAGSSTTNAPVTVTENPPAGLTLMSMMGDNWTCPVGGTTCTRSDGLAGGASYSPITVTVNVGAEAVSPLVNSVTVSGGGSVSATATDSTTLNGTTLGTASIVVGSTAGADIVQLSLTPVTTVWTAQSNASWLHLAAGSTSGTGNAVIHFTWDANTGATRSGTFTIAQENLTVTQAGTGFVAGSEVLTLVSSGLSSPGNIAVDPSGNVFLPDSGVNALKEWNAATKLVTTLVPSGFNFPAAVALDQSGNVYIADYYAAAVEKWDATTHTLSTVVSYGLQGPAGLAVDAQGNIYIADALDGSIKVWNPTAQTLTLWISGLSTPYGLAVDTLGNVYIADYDYSSIIKYDASTGKLVTLISSGIYQPTSVAVDGQGNLYIADYRWAILKWKANTQALSVLVSSGLQTCWGVAVDAQGNVYISDTNNDAIKVDDIGYVALGSSSVTETSAAGSDSVTVQVLPTNLPVVAASDQTWLSITSASGGAIAFSFLANSGAARTAHITVLGQTITVTQAAPGPVLSISKTHSGTVWQGETAATYTVTVTNTSTYATSGQVTVTDTLPAGMSLVSMVGTNWTCTPATFSCSRNTVLAGGASYPPITVTVSVAAGASSPQVNSVTVSGGTAPNATATDSTVIAPYCPCDVNQSGSTGVTDVQQIIKEALGLSPPTHTLSGKGEVSLLEVQMVVNAALGMGCPGT